MSGRETTRRRTLALALVAVPVLLLGLGWLASSLREREGLERENRMLLTRNAEVVRGAVDEGLEELRRREDARPFYLYNHFYTPPDVLALSDPVAVSPLAADPDDPRLVGHFQVDPGGQVRTPYVAEPTTPHARAERVRGVVEREELAPLRALAFVEPHAINNLSALTAMPTPAAQTPDAGATVAATAPVRRVRRPRPRTVAAPATTGNAGPAVAARAQSDAGSLAPSGPLTVSLNAYGSQVYNDLSQAQQGDPEANLRVQQRGRAAPVTRRNPVTWEAVEERQNYASSSGSSGYRPPPQQAPSSSSSPGSTRRPQQARPEPQAAPPAQVAPEPQATAVRPAEEVASRPRPRRARATTAPAAAAVAPPEPAMLTSQLAAEVDYTPMEYRRFGEELILHRVVSHGGAASVQGVVLDRDKLLREWLPSVVTRHGVAGQAPRVVAAGQGECAVREPASRVIDGVELCFPPSALAHVSADLDAPLYLQGAILAFLVLIAAAAVLAVHRAGRRADELNAQKSAFVSAVSHELRTPLTTIRMHSEMLREGLVDEDKRDRFYEDLVQESVRLARLVENVLEISRLEEGRRPLRTVRADLVSHVRGIVEGQARLAAAKGFEVRGPSSEDPLTLRFDGPALEQIVVNLLDNAIKYARGAGERIIDVEVGREGNDAIVTVADRGPGVPEAERDRVFDRFYRVERQETAHMPGTGLGLALVRELARAHGGDATLGASAHGGCLVRVRLPMEPGDTA